MRVLVMAQYYPPEEVGAGIWIGQLATDLAARGHEVTVLTAFPNYPRGEVFRGYRRRLFHEEMRDGVHVVRSYIFATSRRSFWPRAVSFGSYCLSALMAGLALRGPYDAVYAILPPLPLGVTAALVAHIHRARLVVNVQDLYPHFAVATGYLRFPPAIRFFEAMEKWIYRQAGKLVVISEGFRDHVLHQGASKDRVRVIANWADPDQIRPGLRENAFRRETGAGASFLVVYSGGLGHNASLLPLLEAASRLRNEPFHFVIAGDGVQKPSLVETARRRGLTNVVFLPFQPLARYAEVLAAADLTVVSLQPRATLASVPSKVYKQMAAGRPVLAVTESGTELDRLVTAAQCGWTVAPEQTGRLVDILRYAVSDPSELTAMGARARQYVLEHCSRRHAVDEIEAVLGGETERLRPAAA